MEHDNIIDFGAIEMRRQEEHRRDTALRDAELRRVAEEGRSAIAAIEDDRVRELVTIVDRFLSLGVGSEKGYFPTVGAPDTRRLRAALAAFGVVPDHDRIRVKQFPGQTDRLTA